MRKGCPAPFVCGVVWCGVVWCGVVWCGMVWCGALRYGKLSCSMVTGKLSPCSPARPAAGHGPAGSADATLGRRGERGGCCVSCRGPGGQGRGQHATPRPHDHQVGATHLGLMNTRWVGATHRATKPALCALCCTCVGACV